MIHGIKNAFENIKRDCEAKLKELFPQGVPEVVRTRYETELGYLEKSEHLDDFEIFRLMSKEARRCSSYFGMRGTVMGSYIYYLLGNNCFNPLPIHYYCPECGEYEEVGGKMFGIDLPERSCPKCGCKTYADGYNLSVESIWGVDGLKRMSFEYEVIEEFFVFAKRVLQKAYPRNTVVPQGMFTRGNKSDDISIFQRGFVILQEGTTVEDYSDLSGFLEDGEPCILAGAWEVEQHGLKNITMLINVYAETLVRLQRSTGVYLEDITNAQLREVTWNSIHNTTLLPSDDSSLFRHIQPRSITAMVNIHSLAHSTYASVRSSKDDGKYEGDIIKWMNCEENKKYPCYSRDDFFDRLVETGMDRSDAFRVSEKIRMGRAHKSQDWMEEYDIPEEIKVLAKNCLYVWPRAHSVEKMLQYARIAYYGKVDSRALGKAIFGKNKGMKV